MSALDPADIRRIEANHSQDDVWFRSGHHDPNGYVCVAHQDRSALLAHIRAITPPEYEPELDAPAGA